MTSISLGSCIIPFARVAKQENDTIFLRPPISPAGSGQSMARSSSDLSGPSTRATSYGSYASYGPYPRPSLAHRASEPPTSLCFLAPPLYRRFVRCFRPRICHTLSDNRLTMSFRALPCNKADQDMEDSYTSNGLSRFSSIANICGNDTSVTSAIYSNVGSCISLVCLPT